MHCTTLHHMAIDCITLHCTTLNFHYTAIYWTILHYTTLHFTTLYYITLHCTLLHSTALHCTALHWTGDIWKVSMRRIRDIFNQAPYMSQFCVKWVDALLFQEKLVGNHFYMAKWTLIYPVEPQFHSAYLSVKVEDDFGNILLGDKQCFKFSHAPSLITSVCLANVKVELSISGILLSLCPGSN